MKVGTSKGSSSSGISDVLSLSSGIGCESLLSSGSGGVSSLSGMVIDLAGKDVKIPGAVVCNPATK